MVVWCRICGALMGLREPYTNWEVDRNALCPICAAHEKLISTESNFSFVEGDQSTVVVGEPK